VANQTSRSTGIHITSPEIIIPDNTEDFMQFVSDMARFHATIATHVEVVAAEMRKGLANPIGTKRAYLRADLKMNAMRVTRPIAHVAATETAASKAWLTAWRTFTRLYTAGPQTHQRGFRVS
jgi:hypothetical protein